MALTDGLQGLYMLEGATGGNWPAAPDLPATTPFTEVNGPVTAAGLTNATALNIIRSGTLQSNDPYLFMATPDPAWTITSSGFSISFLFYWNGTALVDEHNAYLICKGALTRPSPINTEWQIDLLDNSSEVFIGFVVFGSDLTTPAAATSVQMWSHVPDADRSHAAGWYSIVATTDAVNSLTIAVNCVEQTSTYVSPIHVGGNRPVSVGIWYQTNPNWCTDGGGTYLNCTYCCAGRYSNIYLWNRQLTAQERQQAIDIQCPCVPKAGKTITFDVSTSPSSPIVYTSNVLWITIAGPSSGSGTVTLTVAANPTEILRIGTVTANDQTFIITQLGI